MEYSGAEEKEKTLVSSPKLSLGLVPYRPFTVEQT